MAKKTEKKNTDLVSELGDKRIKLRDLRFGIAGSKSKNVKEQKLLKKEIAKILTALNGTN